MIDALFVAIAVGCSALYYNVPKNSLLAVMFTGASGYFVVSVVHQYLGYRYIGLLLGIMTLGILAGFFARRYKLPTTVFFQAGIIPLVPGRALYRMMYHIVFENYSEAIKHGTDAIMVAGILAVGIYLTSVISDTIKLRLIQARRRDKLDEN